MMALSRSTHFDWRLASYDLDGSRAHAKALHQAEATPSAQLAETTARNTLSGVTDPKLIHPGVLAYYRQAGLVR